MVIATASIIDNTFILNILSIKIIDGYYELAKF